MIDARRYLFQAHELIGENSAVHQSEASWSNLRRKIHLPQHLGLKINSWGYFGEIHTIRPQFKDRPLRDVSHWLTSLPGVGAREGDLLNAIKKLTLSSLLVNHQLAVLNMRLDATSGEGSTKEYFLRILRNVDKAAAASNSGAELGDIDISVLIRLRQT